jgi:hypothetical protein
VANLMVIPLDVFNVILVMDWLSVTPAQIQTLFFYSNQPVWRLFCNLKSYIQVYPTKFTSVKIKSRRNFGESIRFFSKI